jgi:hypothetical protein
MTSHPTRNHGEGDPEAAARFNDAETRFVESASGKQKVLDGAQVRPEEQPALDEAERLGKARAKDEDPAATPGSAPK